MKEFIASLERLALPAEGQLASLPDGCCKADELALDFDNFCRAEGVVLQGEVNGLVEELDHLLARMSGTANAELWTDEALRLRPEWEQVRSMARQILKSINEQPQPTSVGILAPLETHRRNVGARGCTMTINDLTVIPKGLDREAFLQDWYWLLPKDAKPVLITVMGDVFAQDSTGTVHYLSTCSGDYEVVAENGQRFQELLKDTDFVSEHLQPERVQELRAAGLTLKPGQCYSHKHPLVLGGEDVVENYEACDAAVHVSLAGQTHEQTKGLPAGTRINEVRIVGAEKSKPWWKIW